LVKNLDFNNLYIKTIHQIAFYSKVDRLEFLGKNIKVLLNRVNLSIFVLEYPDMKIERVAIIGAGEIGLALGGGIAQKTEVFFKNRVGEKRA